jgi:hypothetical protein
VRKLILVAMLLLLVSSDDTEFAHAFCQRHRPINFAALANRENDV